MRYVEIEPLARAHAEAELALPILARLRDDPETAGWAESALDDIAMFVKPSPPA